MKISKLQTLILILILFSVIKLVFGFHYHHQDADHYYYWGEFLAKNGFDHFYEWGIPNSMPPTYPPVVYYVLFITRKAYLLIHDFVWFFHLRIPFYFFRSRTSVFIPWYEARLVVINFNKIPAILADLFNAILIYKIVLLVLGKSKEKLAFILSALSFLSPPVWYSSSVWGQVDSLYIMFILISLYQVWRKKFLSSMIFLLISVLTKPTAVYAAPVFIYIFWKEADWRLWLKGFLLSLVFTFFLYLPFNQSGNFLWIAPFFKSSLSGELNQMVANAFNFWVLLFGFDNRPDFSLLAGKPLYFWAYGLFAIFLFLIFVFLKKKRLSAEKIFQAGFLFSLLAFLVLPRVHERYFYPVLIFSILMAQFGRKWLAIYLIFSFISFANLYHFWWAPRFEPLVSFLSNMVIIKTMILAEIFIFFYGLINLGFKKTK